MNISALLLAFLTQSADSQGVADLFDVLDQNVDGRVTQDEISASQQPFFRRALRVADRNEDGELTREELKTAVADPEPVVVSIPQRPAGRAGNFDLSQLDRNKDGNISKDELPEPLKERFQRAFDQYGQDQIPVQVLQQLARGQAPGSPAPDRADMKKVMEEKSMQQDAPDRGRILAAVKRLDTDRDGKLSKTEAARAPGLLRLLDRDRNGEISASELAAMNRNRSDSNPRSNRKSDTESARPAPQTTQPRSTAANAIFARLDTDKDGKLTGDEVPARMRQNARQLDVNGDKAISAEEFLRAVRRQEQRSR